MMQGHNNPPAVVGFDAHADDLMAEAANFLDGAPIENDGQAEAVAKLLDEARKAHKDADAQRAAEKKPHDDAAAAVQAMWKPVLSKFDSIVKAAKAAQTAWLIRKDEEQRAAARAAQEEADRLARIADEANAKLNPAVLGDAEALDAVREEAARKAKEAARLDKAKPQTKGGARAVSLRSYWTPELVDPVAALKHYRATQPEALKAWLLEQARKDVNAGARNLPGFEIKEDRRAA